MPLDCHTISMTTSSRHGGQYSISADIDGCLFRQSPARASARRRHCFRRPPRTRRSTKVDADTAPIFDDELDAAFTPASAALGFIAIIYRDHQTHAILSALDVNVSAPYHRHRRAHVAALYLSDMLLCRPWRRLGVSRADYAGGV